MNGRLPDLSKSTAKLAADNARVGRFVDSLTERISELADAATRSDWTEIQRLSEYIARCSEIFSLPLVSQAAMNAAEAVNQGDELEIRRATIRLIGACGRVRRRETASGEG